MERPRRLERVAAERSLFASMDHREIEPVRVRNLSVGQVAEWLVWTRLVATSGGDLHMFLPLDDRVVDAAVARYAVDSNGNDSIVLTKVDVVSVSPDREHTLVRRQLR
jgi:hypothetical protein